MIKKIIGFSVIEGEIPISSLKLMRISCDMTIDANGSFDKKRFCVDIMQDGDGGYPVKKMVQSLRSLSDKLEQE